MTVWKTMKEFCSRRRGLAIVSIGVGYGVLLGLAFWVGWRLCQARPAIAPWVSLFLAAGSALGVTIAFRSIFGHRLELERVLESQREVLREKEQRLEWALAATGDGVWDWKIQSGSIHHNHRWCRILGLDDRFLEHALDTFEQQIHPEDKPSVMERIRRSLETGEPYASEHRMLRADGNAIHVVDRGNIVERNERGEPTRMVGSMVDVTERKLAEEELRETNIILEEQTARASTLAAEAEFASVSKSDFLANMSHEIRTPMNGVIGMAGLLLDTQLDPLQRKYAEIVRQSGESLLGLLNDILDLSKIEAGKLELESIPFQLAELLEETAALLSVRAAQKGLEFVWAVDSAVPRTISADPGRIRQILTNLAGNAIKFTEKGRVSVMVRLESRTETQVILRFSVQDTGIGIPPERSRGCARSSCKWMPAPRESTVAPDWVLPFPVNWPN
ncbi:MAG: PAS domain-containing protein [Fibrobacteres bacterium]|nr:PAS domain-containing protein [Fibrobacterota bacterium]